MKLVVLSDHPADRLNKKEVQRENQYVIACKEYENAVCERQQRIDKNKTAMSNAWKQRELWQTIKYLFKSVFAVLSSKPTKPVKERPGEEDRIWESGQEGEQQVQGYFQGQLDDEWILLSGYKNQKGEIDKILVGSEGVFAIEIKNINGSVYCNGDRWWKDKYDKYGNLVEINASITDRKKRSPSQQLNEPTDLLQKFLRRTLPTCQLYRIVVFTHKSSEFEDLNNLTVDEAVILEDWDLKSTFKKSKFKLAPEDVKEIARQIEADHHFLCNRSKNRFLKKTKNSRKNFQKNRSSYI